MRRRWALALALLIMVAVPAPASALIGNSPLAVFEPNGAAFELNLEANKGIVTAAADDRFSLRVTGTFGGAITDTVIIWDVTDLAPAKNEMLIKGSTVGIIMDIDLPLDEATKIAAALEQGGTVAWNVAIELVLSTGAGDKVLDFTEVSGTL
jgi:hypothetical protein